jgi:hypothetical protein
VKATCVRLGVSKASRNNARGRPSGSPAAAAGRTGRALGARHVAGFLRLVLHWAPACRDPAQHRGLPLGSRFFRPTAKETIIEVGRL